MFLHFVCCEIAERQALSSAYFIARVAFRLVHSEKTTPRRLLEEVPKAQWLQWKLKEAGAMNKIPSGELT